MTGKRDDTRTELEVSLPIDCFPIQGKTVSSTSIAGRILKMGETTAEAVLDKEIAVHINLKIRLSPEDAEKSQ